MKKLIAFLMTAVLLTAASTTAFAATIDEGDGNPATSTATVSTEIAPTYTVSIPENVSVTFNAASTEWGSIEVTQAQIDPDHHIVVSLEAGALKNSVDNTKTIPYTVEDATGVFTYASYLAEGNKTDLTIKIAQSDWNAAYAGDYSDTVTFTVSYEPINAAVSAE